MRFDLGTFRLESLSPREVLSRALAFPPGRPCHIVTFNPLMYLDAKARSDFAAALKSADLLLAESSGIALAAKFLYNLAIAPVAGVDMVESWFAESEAPTPSYYFLGGRPGVAEAAARNVSAKYPSARVAGFRDGFFDEAQSGEVAASIVSSGAGILLAGLGSPRQEIWISRHKHLLPGVCAAVGVGGALDIFSGRVRRAPAAFRSAGVEWLWRLVSEPRRAPGIIRLPLFAAEMIKLKLSSPKRAE